MSLPDNQQRNQGKPHIEGMKTVGQISDLGSLEKKITQLRREQLIQLLEHIHALHINSSKEAKTQAFLNVIFQLTGRRLQIGQEVRMYIDGENEPVLTHAIDVAAMKTVRAIRGKQGDGVAAYGADVNAFTEDDTGLLTPQHKLERHFDELPNQELRDLFTKMKKQYCFPESGRVRIVWDIASQFINGKTLSTADKIEIISKPIDPFIFDTFFYDAVESGLLLSSNLHFGAIECLIANKKIESIAILPKELEDLGYDFEAFRQTDSGLYVVAMKAILDNTSPLIQ